MAERALRYLLITNGAVSSLVGSKVFHKAAPQGTPLPLLVFWRVSTETPGDMTGEPGIKTARFQVDCYGPSLEGAIALGGAVTAALKKQRGIIAGDDVTSISLQGERDLTDVSLPGARWALDFDIRYRP